MFDPQKIIAVFDICPSPAVIWPRVGYNIISVTYYSIFVVWNQLKCFFPPEKLSFPVHFPTAPGPHPAPRLFPRAFRFRPKTAIFPCLFEQKSAFFTVFTACFCAFIQSSSPVRTEFPLYSVQNSRKSACHFYLCTTLKPRIFPCAGATKGLPFACKEEP